LQNSKGLDSDNTKMRTVTVVLPCYNEESAVAPVLERLLILSREWSSRGSHSPSGWTLSLDQVFIVDDGSTDRTRAAVEEWETQFLSALSPRPFKLSVLTHPERRGYGAALKTGIASSESDYIAFYDVDGTYDPGLLPDMIRVLESDEAEMVCGDRLSSCQHMPFTREVGNRLFVGTINVLYRTRVYDSCTGMRVFTKNMQPFFSSSALPDGLDYSLAMTLSFLRTGHRLAEIPIPYAKRIGRSKLRVLTDGPRFFLRILASWIHTPLHLRQVADQRKQLLQSSVVTKKR